METASAPKDGGNSPPASGSGTTDSAPSQDSSSRTTDATFTGNSDDRNTVRTAQTEPTPSGDASNTPASTASSTTDTGSDGGDGNPFDSGDSGGSGHSGTSSDGQAQLTPATTVQNSRSDSKSSDLASSNDNPFEKPDGVKPDGVKPDETETTPAATASGTATTPSTNGSDTVSGTSTTAATQSNNNASSQDDNAAGNAGGSGDGGNPFFVAGGTSDDTGNRQQTDDSPDNADASSHNDASNSTGNTTPAFSNNTQTADGNHGAGPWNLDAGRNGQANTADGNDGNTVASQTGNSVADSGDAVSGRSSSGSPSSGDTTMVTFPGGTTSGVTPHQSADASVNDPRSGADTVNRRAGNGPSLNPTTGTDFGRSTADGQNTAGDTTASAGSDADSSPRPLFSPGEQPESKQLPRGRETFEDSPRGGSDSRLGGYRVGSGGSAQAKSTTTVQTAGASDDVEYPFGKPDDVPSDNDSSSQTESNDSPRSASSTPGDASPFGQSATGNTADSSSQGSPVDFPATDNADNDNEGAPDGGRKNSGRAGNRNPGTNPVRQGDNPKVYSVQNGDNYWTISRKAYGTAKYFQALAAYNRVRIPDPKKLRPGMKVLVPAAAVLKKRFPKLSHVSRKGTGADAKQPPGFYRDRSGQPMYRVGKSDTLGSIAQKHLGRASRWIQIYQMNRKRIKNPNRLKIGTELRLPADASRIQVVRRPQQAR